MRALLSIILLCISFNSLPQNRWDLAVRLSDKLSQVITEKHYEQFYNTTEIGVGVNYNFNNSSGSMEIDGIFAISGNVNSSLTGNINNSILYTMVNHFIGARLIYTLFKKEKRFRSFISFSVSSQVYSNYRNKYLEVDHFIPIPEVEKYSYSTGSHGGPPYYTSYYTYTYLSNPIIMDAFIGCDIRLYKSLNLNIGIGYSFRKLNYNYVRWTENENGKITSSKKTVQLHKKFHFIDLQLGLSYTFPFQKHSKAE